MEVRKLDEAGQLVWRYSGRLLEEREGERVLEAIFDRETVRLGPLELRRGDRMIEHFYSDRWYNIFEIRDPKEGLRGWYCNIARPAQFTPQAIIQEDLALDLVVTLSGKMKLLDQEEFDELPLNPDERRQAEDALDQLKRMIKTAAPPFSSIAATD